jgi:hypothetical protein
MKLALLVTAVAFTSLSTLVLPRVASATDDRPGCEASGVAAANAADGDVSISITVTVADGDCIEDFELQACVPSACVATVTRAWTAPAGTEIGHCKQVGSSPTYCESPPPVASGAPGASIRYSRIGCGNEAVFSIKGGNAAASVTASCSGCPE